MKKEMQKKIEEIKSEKKVPDELKNATKKKILYNFLIAIAIMLYFIFLIFGSKNSIKNIRTIDFNIFSLILLGISIFLFEKAYKKDNGSIAIHGIEILTVALITLFFSYIVFELDENQKKYFYMVGAYIAGYYIIKSIFIGVIAKNKYKKVQIQNMKEVIEPVIAERRESLRKTDDNDIKTTKRRGRPSKTNKNEINKQDEIQQKATPKKRGRPKKNVANKNEQKSTEKTKEISKKRGRPKKIKEKITIETKQEPKRRGRPRKVV